MEFFLSITYGLTKIIGILDIYFDDKKQRFSVSHIPSVIYGKVMKLSHIAACVYFFYKSYQEFNACITDQRIWQIVRLTVDTLFAIHIITVCLEMLMKRKALFVLLSTFLKYRQTYPQELCFYKSKLRTYLMVIIITISVFYKFPFALRYAMTRPNYCDPHKENQLRSVCLILLWCLTLSIECCLLGAFVTADILMSHVVVNLQILSKELKLLQATNLSECWNLRWSKVIIRSILKLIQQQRLIRLLLQKCVDCYIWTLFMSLFNRSLQLIFLTALQIMLFREKEQLKENLANFLFILTHILCFMQLFYISDRLNNKYIQLQDISFKAALNMKMPRNKIETILKNSLDALIVELGQAFFRIRFLHIFQIDRRTIFAILCCCVNQLLVLLQQIMQYNIAVHKEFIRNKNESIQTINNLFKNWGDSIKQD